MKPTPYVGGILLEILSLGYFIYGVEVRGGRETREESKGVNDLGWSSVSRSVGKLRKECPVRGSCVLFNLSYLFPRVFRFP